MLALRCQFLQGTYQAAAPGRPTWPEWPPHPARLHAALVAAGWALGNGSDFPEELRTALRWVERLGAPSVAAPPHVGSRTLPAVFVPRNLTQREIAAIRGSYRRGQDAAVSRQMGRVDRVFPTTVPGDRPVWFYWPDAEVPADILRALRLAANEVQYLGSSRSPVCCDVAEEPPEATLVPVDDAGEETLRVSTEGLTDALIDSRFTVSRNLAGTLVPYAAPRPARMRAAVGPFGELVVLARTGGFGLTIEHTGLVTKALRAAVLANAGDGAPAILHGHGRNPHAAFLPLPNVGHPSSTGELLGLAVAIPRDADPSERVQIVEATRSVRWLLIHRDLAPWTLGGREEAPERRTLDPATWIGPSRRWRTATPIVLDRHPKRNRGETVEDVVRTTFANALLPQPTEVNTSPYPWLGGAVAAAMHAGHGLPRGLAVHVDVRFDREIEGPLLVGRARYFGVGLLRPWRDRSGG